MEKNLYVWQMKCEGRSKKGVILDIMRALISCDFALKQCLKKNGAEHKFTLTTMRRVQEIILMEVKRYWPDEETHPCTVLAIKHCTRDTSNQNSSSGTGNWTHWGSFSIKIASER